MSSNAARGRKVSWHIWLQNGVKLFRKCNLNFYSKDPKLYLVQLNKYEADPNILQNFQIDTALCLIIHAFCKVYIHEIVFVLLCRTARTISGSQLLQNTWINCFIALEILKKIWISLVFIYLYDCRVAKYNKKSIKHFTTFFRNCKNIQEIEISKWLFELYLQDRTSNPAHFAAIFSLPWSALK